MTDLAWMKTYIGDEAAVTGHLTAEEFGAYERLRRHYWQHGELPDDETRMARVTGIDLNRWQEMANAIVSLLTTVLAKLDQERTTASKKRQGKIEAGIKGANARWQKDGNTNGRTIANGNTNANANSKPIANAMAKPMDNQWPPAPAPDEVRYEERLVPTRESVQRNGSVSSQEEYEAHCQAKVSNSYAAAKGGDL